MRHAGWLLTLILTFGAACTGGNSPTGPGTGGGGGFTLSVSANALSVVRNANGMLTITLTVRTGSPVTWIVSGGGAVLDFFDSRYIYNSTHVRWTGAQTGITTPVDGSTYVMGRVWGMITP